MSRILTALSLRHASSAHFEAMLRDGGGEERQPPPRKFVFSDERQAKAPQTLDVWTGQEPGERIANTILLCAIRDRASQVTLEPSAKGVSVRFQIEGGVREQKLPGFALAPIVRHFVSLTRGATPETLAGDESENANDESSGGERESLAPNGEAQPRGQVRLSVDEHCYNVRFSPLSTQWGEGVKVQFLHQA